MKKVVYNECYGGFGLSDLAVKWIKDNKGFETDEYFYWHERRDHEHLVAVVEALGSDANGHCADLQIEEIPDGAEFEISEYDGMESVVPPRQSW